MFKLLKIPILCWKESLKQIKNKTKEQKWGYFGTLAGTLGSILLGNLLLEKGIVRAVSGNNKGKGSARAAYGKEWNF